MTQVGWIVASGTKLASDVIEKTIACFVAWRESRASGSTMPTAIVSLKDLRYIDVIRERPHADTPSPGFLM
jgi:hypothetical protein